MGFLKQRLIRPLFFFTLWCFRKKFKKTILNQPVAAKLPEAVNGVTIAGFLTPRLNELIRSKLREIYL